MDRVEEAVRALAVRVEHEASVLATRPEPTPESAPRPSPPRTPSNVPDHGRPRPDSDRISTTAPDLSPNSAGMWPVITLSDEMVAASGLTPKVGSMRS